jgi:hypothetical protein
MPGNVFISYRRDDAAAWAGRLHMALERQFRRDQLFMDVDSIQAGLDFAKVIDARDTAGRRRLDDPADFMRLEVESALRRDDIRVVPVLVDGASLPKAEQLPEGMQGLVRRQAWPLSHARFGPESDGLIGEISRYVTRAGGSAAAPARTDWAGEASRFFFYTLGGLSLIAAVVGIGLAGDYLRLGRWPTNHDAVWLSLALGTTAWSLVAGGLFAKLVKLRSAEFAAAWITSSIGASLLTIALLHSGRAFGYVEKQGMEIGFTLVALLGAIYVIVSGPALILWRRRKHGG